MDADFKQAMLASNWSSICRRTEVHLEGMSTGWSNEAYKLVAEKVRQFVSQPAPKKDDELHRRFSQDRGLTAIISTVSHIEMMVGKYPARGDDRLHLIKVVCSLALPARSQEYSELHSAISAITMQVSSIAADELMLASRRR